MSHQRMNLKALEAAEPWEWPDDAADVLLAVLRDREAGDEDRVLAANLSRDAVVVDDEIAGELLARLKDTTESEELRATAALALGPVLEMADTYTFDDADMVPITETTFLRIVEALHEVFADDAQPRELRRRVLEASVHAPQDWHRDAVRDAYHDADPAWRLSAVFAMEWVPGFDDEIVEALISRDDDIRFEAVCAAGNREVDRAWPIIATMLETETDKAMLLAAIDAAASIRPDEVGSLLVDLSDSDDEDVAGAAIDAMTMAALLWEMDSWDEENDQE